MAGESIGPLAIKVTVASDGVSTGLQAAAQAMNQGLAKIAGDVTRVSSGLGDLFSGDLTRGIRQMGMGSAALATDIGKVAEKALGNPGRFLAEDVIGGLAIATSKIPVIGGLLSLPFEGMASAGKLALDAFDQGSERVLTLGRAARATGLDISEMQVFGSVVGDIDLAVTAMHRLQSEAQKAAVEGAGADNAFTRLGLNAMRLTTEGTGLQTWMALADKLKAAGPGAAIREVDEIFGKRMGASVMEQLMKGSGFVEKREGLFKLFGADADEGTLSLIKRTKEAQAEINIFKEGFQNQVTIGLAPVLSGLAEVLPRLSELGLSAKGLEDVVFNIASGVAVFAGSLVDMFKDPAAALERLSQVWDRVKDLMIQGAVQVGKTLGESIRTGMLSSSTVQGWFFNEGQYRDQWNEILARAGAQQLPGKFKEKGLFDGIFGGGGREEWFGVGPAAPNTADAMIAAFAKARRARDEVNDEANLLDPFARWASSLEDMDRKIDSPFRKLRQQMLTIRGVMEGAPNFANPFDPESYLRAEAAQQKLAPEMGFQLLQQLRSATGGAPLGSQFVGAAEAGSREAYSAATVYNAETESVEQEIKRRLEEMNQLQKTQNDLGQRTVDVLQAMRSDEGWNFP